MTRKDTMPTKKLIPLIAFICAALMTSLFIFRHQHQTEALNLAEGSGTVFPAPRELKPFDLITANNQKFTPQHLLNHWTLLFFGFTHCPDICPTTMEMLKRAYTTLHPQYPNLQVVLVSLDPDRDTPQKLLQYTQSFHADFIGVTGKRQELRKLQSQLGIASIQENTTDTHYQIQHTSTILLINPQGQWMALYPYGMRPDAFIQAFKQSIRYVS